MADGPKKKDEKHEATAPEGKGGSKKIILIGGAIALLLVFAGGGFFVWNKMQKDKEETVSEEASAEEARGAKKDKGKNKDKDKEASIHGEKKEKSEGSSGFAALEPFIVNLLDNTGTRYLKVTLQLEMDKQTGEEEVKAKTPQIRDAIIVLLSSKSYADIGTIQGKYQLRDEIIARVNQILSNTQAKTAYFTEFVVQ